MSDTVKESLVDTTEVLLWKYYLNDCMSAVAHYLSKTMPCCSGGSMSMNSSATNAVAEPGAHMTFSYSRPQRDATRRFKEVFIHVVHQSVSSAVRRATRLSTHAGLGSKVGFEPPCQAPAKDR